MGLVRMKITARPILIGSGLKGNRNKGTEAESDWVRVGGEKQQGNIGRS